MVERDFDGVLADNHTNEILNTNPGEIADKTNYNPEVYKSTDSFEDFSNNTTLHGVRFIGDHTSNLPRRLIWLGIILLSASVFAVQVVDRIQYYMQSPITVNFKVNYNTSLAFPSVTICNQNLFRVTAVYEKKLSNVIDAMFGDGETGQNITDDYYNITLDFLYTQLAHTKEDFIVKCSWGNSECSPDNFTTSLTSHGICYTFNKVDSPDEAISVEASGVDHGLRLILNTEKYEKTTGPHKTDGIKVIATDQSEIPSVDEVGLSISAGSHAFVGLNVIALNNLEAPYGRCGAYNLLSTDRYTTDSCLLECQTNFIVDMCKCRHFYMPDLTGNTRLCNIRDFFNCLQNSLRVFFEEKDVICDCPTSCTYNIYETSVSYAKKSSWKTVLEDNARDLSRRKDINETFYTTKEIKNIMDINAMMQLQNTMNDTLSYFHELATRMLDLFEYSMIDERSLYNLNDETIHAATRREELYNYQLFIVEKNFIGGRDAMEEDGFGALCQGYSEFLTDIIHKAFFLLTTDDKSNAAMTYMLLEGSLVNKVDVAQSIRMSYSKLINSYKQGEPILNHTYRHFNSSLHDAAIPKPLLQETLLNTDVTNGTVLNYDDIEKVSTGFYNLYTIIGDMFNNFPNQFKVIQMENITAIVSEVAKACEVFLGKKSLFYSEIIEKPAIILKQRKNELAMLKSNYEIALESALSNAAGLRSASSDAHFTLQPINEILESSLKYTENKHDDNITKFDVAYTLTGSEMSLQIRNLELILSKIKARIIGLRESLPSLINRVYYIWEHMLKFHDDTIRYDSIMNDSILSDEDGNGSLPYTGRVWPMKRRYMAATDKLEAVDHTTIENIRMLQEKMEAYVQSHNMDEQFYEENFLEVDIFFKELRSEQIDQQKAYDEFALLCDIGGSMGLFIGGSAITFFEIVDFLLLCCVHKLCRRKL